MHLEDKKPRLASSNTYLTCKGGAPVVVDVEQLRRLGQRKHVELRAQGQRTRVALVLQPAAAQREVREGAPEAARGGHDLGAAVQQRLGRVHSGPAATPCGQRPVAAVAAAEQTIGWRIAGSNSELRRDGHGRRSLLLPLLLLLLLHVALLTLRRRVVVLYCQEKFVVTVIE